MIQAKEIFFAGVLITLTFSLGAFAVFTPSPPADLDFANDYLAIYTDATTPGGLLYTLVPESDRAIFNSFTPEKADINGGYTDNPVGVSPNGMLDCRYELAIISAICKKPAGAQCIVVPSVNDMKSTWKRDLIFDAWVPNINTFRSQGGQYVALAENMAPALVGPLYEILVGLIMLGDSKTNEVVAQLATLLPGGSFNIASYITFPYLAKDGDADGDGRSNYEEYLDFGGVTGKSMPTPALYLSAVLDPRLSCGACLDASGQDTDGDGLPDSVEMDLTHTNPYEADSDGDGVSDGMEVLVYGTDPNSVDSKPSPLPASGYAGLMVLVALLATAGVRAGLRKAIPDCRW